MYKNDIRKKSAIIGEIALSELLKKHNLSYNKLIIETNENGKPYIKNEDIFFNISHSFDYVITVISKKEIGIDIEKIRKVRTNVTNFFATENEKKYIFSQNNNIDEKTFKIYALKEAYLKMKGKDLMDIANIEFTIKENQVTCSDTSVTSGFINLIKGYVIAYCEKK